MASMQPYYSFTKKPQGKQNLLMIELPDAKPVALVDYYCTNPGCDCKDVLLELCDFTPSQKFDNTVEEASLKRLASFYVNTQDWTLHGMEMLVKNRPIEPYLRDFSKSLTKDARVLLRRRLQEAKAYARDGAPNLPALAYQPGQCVPFVEIYPEHTPNQFQFQHMGTQYLVDDQYCIDPACTCNEAVLTYVSLTHDDGVNSHRFVLRLSLATGTYTVEQANGYSTEEMRQIHNAYMAHIHRNLGLFRRRYAKMKAYGRTQIPAASKPARRSAPIVKSSKIGRNDPCPCGSGKKFKKCCGLSSGA